MSHEKKSFLLASLAVLLWSTVATAFKITLRGMNFAELVLWASLTSFVALFLIAFFTRRSKLKNAFGCKSFLLGAINPFLYYSVLFKAYSLLPAQEAQPLNYTWPIMISLFSVLFLKEKFRLRTLAGLIIAFVGVVLISTHGEFSSLRFHNTAGVALALGSSVIWASFWILNILDKRDAVIKLLGAFATGTLYAALSLLLQGNFRMPPLAPLLGAVYIGLFEMGVTFYLWLKALEYSTDRGRTSTLAYLSPFLSFFFIALILKEKILLSSAVGLLLIVGGVIFQRTAKEEN